jgi:hypothetical protein
MALQKFQRKNTSNSTAKIRRYKKSSRTTAKALPVTRAN